MKWWQRNLAWWFGLAFAGLALNAVLSYQHLAGLDADRHQLARAQWTLALSNGLNLVLLALVAALVHRSVLRRERDARALRRSEARFQRLAHSNLIGIITADAQGLIGEANDA